MKQLKLISASLALLLLSACAGKEDYYGYSFSDNAALMVKTNDLKIGVTTKEKVLDLLGSPTATSDYGDLTYYYIHQESKQVAFCSKQLQKQEILAIKFNKQGKISAIEEYSKDQYKNLKYDQSVTSLKGSESSAISKVINNIGKFRPSGNLKKNRD